MTTAIVIGLLAVLVVSNAITWVVTRLRNGCDHGRHRHANTEQASDDTAVDVTSPDIRWQVAP